MRLFHTFILGAIGVVTANAQGDQQLKTIDLNPVVITGTGTYHHQQGTDDEHQTLDLTQLLHHSSV